MTKMSLPYTVLIILFFQNVYSEVRFRCIDSLTKPPTSFNPDKHNIEGRYEVEYCYNFTGTYAEWKVELHYLENVSELNCTDKLGLLHYKRHSYVLYDITQVQCGNEKYVCVSTDLDLVFRGCFELVNTVYHTHNRVKTHDNKFTYINSSISGPEYFNDTKPYGRETSPQRNGTVSVSWTMPRVPLISGRYEVKMCPVANANASCPKNKSLTTLSCPLVDNYTCRCEFQASPDQYYRLYLTRFSPWSNGQVFNDPERNINLHISHYKFKTENPIASNNLSPESHGPGYFTLWVTLAAAVTIIFAATLVYVFRKKIPLHRVKKFLPFKQMQTKSMTESKETEKLTDKPRTSNLKPEIKYNHRLFILFLYEEEFVSAGKQFVYKFKNSLKTVGQVIDIHGPGWKDDSDDNSWKLSQCVNDPRVKVVVLYTPRLEMLLKAGSDGSNSETKYYHKLLKDNLTLKENPYKKFFFVTVKSLKIEMGFIENSTPYREYRLPEAARLLLEHLTQTDQSNQYNQTDQCNQTNQCNQTSQSDQYNQINQCNQPNQSNQNTNLIEEWRLDKWTTPSDDLDAVSSNSNTESADQFDASEDGQCNQLMPCDINPSIQEKLNALMEATEQYINDKPNTNYVT